MYFQLNPPSISKIRAKFIIEKLGNYPENIDNINLFFTGRTGAGKTTLSNRLLGSNYFLSTGHQDCTKEINLIEFPIGLKCLDTPGVCSDELLENYNRVALGIKQIEDCPIVEEITLARYRENLSRPQEENLKISEFRNLEFHPDLIYYLIGPEKQFTRGDRQYLRDLLKRHQNIIYVFNMFVNKQTGISYTAKEAHIEDTATQILKVHRQVVGEDSQPVIIGVNCWTGEGISELLHQSHIMLKGKKGEIFKELIQYQQQKTPNEYVKQVKQELIKIYAHAACEKPVGTDTCDQPIHELSHNLFDFIFNLPIQSEEDKSSISMQVNDIVKEVLEKPNFNDKHESLDDKVDYVIAAQKYIFSEGIDYFNELIKTYISEIQNQAYELRNSEYEQWENEKQSYQKELDNKSDILSQIDEEIGNLNDVLEPLNQEINELVDEFNYKVELSNSRYVDLVSRRENLNSRIDIWKDRLDNLNTNIERINRSSARLTYEARRSIEKEGDYIDKERSKIQSEDDYLNSLIRDWERNSEFLEEEKVTIKNKLAKRDIYAESRQDKINIFLDNLQEYKKYMQDAQDESNFTFEIIKYFNQELSSLDDEIENRIEEMNGHLQEIRNRLSKDYLDNFDTLEEGINELQEVINRCIDEMSKFENQIFIFHQRFNSCMFKLTTNKMVAQVILKCTEHYFDETGQFEYRGSHYNYFGIHGITVLLALTRMIFFGLDEEYEVFYNNLLQKVENLGLFPNNPTESQIINLLTSNSDSIFDSDLTIMIRKATI